MANNACDPPCHLTPHCITTEESVSKDAETSLRETLSTTYTQRWNVSLTQAHCGIITICVFGRAWDHCPRSPTNSRTLFWRWLSVKSKALPTKNVVNTVCIYFIFIQSQSKIGTDYWDIPASTQNPNQKKANPSKDEFASYVTIIIHIEIYKLSATIAQQRQY